ncbi:MAG: AraC family transcriptional regulator [Chitinophagaceae bacterium]|jgi:AraC-like DNA-binding protein|nr:AraC family transcriptional regulator [Chitinophagaceae bacterium]
MAQKKTALHVYKHADLAKDPLLSTSSTITGLSVEINHALTAFNLFKTHFRSDFITILLVTKGEMTVGSNLNKYRIGKRHVFVAAPHTVKQLISAKEDTIINVISFTGDFLGRIGMPKNTSDILGYLSSQFNPHWKLDKKDATLLLHLMTQLKSRYDTVDSNPYGREILYHSFHILLYEISALSKRYSNLLSTRLSLKENLVMNFFNLVQKQFTTQRSVQQYASQLNVTPKYLTETVKEFSGKNAGEIIDDFVMLEAKLLLDNPALSIGEIAHTLNFSNQSFFGKYFKRFTGMSPKEYRSALQ